MDGVKMKNKLKNSLINLITLFLVIFSIVYAKSPEERIAWWQEARFGMFIHWGVYSIPERGEWLLYQEHIPFNEYKLLADQFTAKNYNPADWVALAQESHPNRVDPDARCVARSGTPRRKVCESPYR